MTIKRPCFLLEKCIYCSKKTLHLIYTLYVITRHLNITWFESAVLANFVSNAPTLFQYKGDKKTDWCDIPVLLEALTIPLRNTSLSLDFKRKLFAPPETEMSRFGLFMPQTSSNKCSTSDILVSASIRTYCRHSNKVSNSNCVFRVSWKTYPSYCNLFPDNLGANFYSIPKSQL